MPPRGINNTLYVIYIEVPNRCILHIISFVGTNRRYTETVRETHTGTSCVCIHTHTERDG